MPRRFQRMAAAWIALALTAAPVLAQEATPGATNGKPACAAGGVGVGDPYFPTMGNGGYDVRHYDLALDLDVARGRIDAATATIAATATLDLCAFNLDFAGLEVDGVTVDGREARHTRTGGELTVAPAAPIANGAAFAVEVAYHGTPRGREAPSRGDVLGELFGRGSAPPATPAADSPEVVGGAVDQPTGVQFDRGWWTAPEAIFVAGEPAGAETWYPVNGHPADKATYALRLTVAKPYAAAANGTLAETVDDGPTRTFVWTSRDPIASYLVTLHAGRLDIEDATGPNGLPIRYAFAEAVPADQRAIYRRVPEIVAHYETLFGPYPFEAAGTTVVGAPLTFALETQTMPIFGLVPLPPGVALPPESRAAFEQVLAHELAHQWFGDSVSPLRWRDIWLNEGFASYADLLWLEHTQGREARDASLERSYVGLRRAARWHDPAALAALNARQVLEAYRERADRPPDDAFRRAYRAGLGAATEEDLLRVPAERGLAQLAALGVPEEAFPGDVVPPTGDPGAAHLFSGPAVYARGALTLHALRERVGDDAFFATLRAWATRYRNGNAGTADFVALAEEVSGEELGAFFDAWLFQPGLPPLPFEEGTR